MYPVIRAKNRSHVIQQKMYHEYDGLEYLQFPKLSRIENISHLFTTRTGGVSKKHLWSMNLSFSRGDAPENVLENYDRIGNVLGCNAEHMVASHQTHTTNIRIVTAEDAGKGVVKERDYSDIDGLITDEKGIALACFYADCVPLYFVDPIKEVIGLAHSGWRGTYSAIGQCMVEKMKESFGCDPADIIAAIGPSICQDCYEISEELGEQFMQGAWDRDEVKESIAAIHNAGLYDADSILKPGKIPGKYQLDLWLANLIVLHKAGIRLENVDVTDVCTCCNPEYLYSHRASQGHRGNLAAFLMINQ
jgi:YfiH family protein